VSFVRVLAVATALGCSVAVVTIDAASSRANGDARVEAGARQVVSELFRTINERRYSSTCDLLADGYFDGSPVGRRRCALGLRIGFMWSNELRVRLDGVRIDGGRVVVEAVVSGAPGTVEVVREAGRFRVLRVHEP
jgi:hypothetical protein